MTNKMNTDNDLISAWNTSDMQVVSKKEPFIQIDRLPEYIDR
jgi:hypothetical protein